jgi:ribosomal protein L29
MANKSLNVRDVRAMSDKQVLDAIEDAREELYTLRLNKASGELKDANLINHARRNLARLMTVVTERRLAQQLSKEENNG